MMDNEGAYLRGYEHLTPNERSRAYRADHIYDAVASEMGVKSQFWGGRTGWVEFMETDMSEEDLWIVAQGELSISRAK